MGRSSFSRLDRRTFVMTAAGLVMAGASASVAAHARIRESAPAYADPARKPGQWGREQLALILIRDNVQTSKWAEFFDGLTVVVSPLIALMQDQVMQLQELDVPAAFLNSSLTLEERRRVETEVARGKYHLLYVAPERLVLPTCLGLLRRAGVAFFAIDEAHCISQWGHDFRPEYRQLALLRERRLEREVDRGDAGLQLLGLARAHEGRGDCRMGQHPGDGELGHVLIAGLGDGIQPVNFGDGFGGDIVCFQESDRPARATSTVSIR